MDIHDIRCVLAVAEDKNFTRAAERLYITQSALSQKINRVERDLGIRLFARTNRSVTLTSAGQTFVEAGLPVVRAYDAFDAAMRAVGVSEKSLSLAFFPLAEYSSIPQLTAAFMSLYPNYHVNISTISNWDMALQRLKIGQLDFAFHRSASGAQFPGISSIVLQSEPMHLLLHKDDPLSRREIAHSTDIHNYHIISAEGAILAPSAEFPYHQIYSDSSSLPLLITGPRYCTLTTQSTCAQIAQRYPYLTSIPFENVQIDLCLSFASSFKDASLHPFYQYMQSQYTRRE